MKIKNLNGKREGSINSPQLILYTGEGRKNTTVYHTNNKYEYPFKLNIFHLS